MSEKKTLTKYAINEEKGIEAQYVEVANPVVLGMHIALGFLIVSLIVLFILLPFIFLGTL